MTAVRASPRTGAYPERTLRVEAVVAPLVANEQSPREPGHPSYGNLRLRCARHRIGGF